MSLHRDACGKSRRSKPGSAIHSSVKTLDTPSHKSTTLNGTARKGRCDIKMYTPEIEGTGGTSLSSFMRPSLSLCLSFCLVFSPWESCAVCVAEGLRPLALFNVSAGWSIAAFPIEDTYATVEAHHFFLRPLTGYLRSSMTGRPPWRIRVSSSVV